MQPRALLLAALLVLLASARAQEADEDSLLKLMQDYVQQAQEALTSSVKDLSMAQEASKWMSNGFNSLKDYWSSLTVPLSNLWPLAPGAAPGTTPAPAV
ncbi:apolipoprotein C-III [Myotis lucifugus]|uniref:Apolipoprotein C-III n=1 Tax=Myotis lucifugus TaxID=59463 RepID=G1QA13_MYOLU|nr:apolipoprotein C-III [Myotis lucifugus]